MKQRYLSAIVCACISNMQTERAGNTSFSPVLLQKWVGLKNTLWFFPVTMCFASCNMKQERIAFKECPKQKLKEESIPQRLPLLFCKNRMRMNKSSWMNESSRSTLTVLREQVASMSMSRIPLYASRIFLQVQLFLVRKREASIKIKKRPCAFSVQNWLKKSDERLKRKCRHCVLHK